jgi:hypothetical protein
MVATVIPAVAEVVEMEEAKAERKRVREAVVAASR